MPTEQKESQYGCMKIKFFVILNIFRGLSLLCTSAAPQRPEVELTIFPPSRLYLGFLKLQLESRFQEVAIHQFRAKNAT
jgi:hypothetical protein